VAQAIVHGLAQVSLAGGVFDQEHFTGPDDALLTVAGRNLHAIVEIDDILPARGIVPVQLIGRLNLPEDDAGRR
jgi:hypothetical protein